MLNKNKIFFLLLLFSIIVILMPSVAHAASDLFEIQSGDKSKEMFLDKLFDSDNLESSPLNNVILTFNTCVLMLGGILAAYTLIAGTMSTAHDGEMLGKKWSAMWLPIRTTVGAAFIFPTVGGFCTAQIIVIWLIHQGIGLANTLWASYLDHMPENNMSSFSGPDKNEVFALAVGVLKSEYCTLVTNKYYEDQMALSSRYKNRSDYPTVAFFSDGEKSSESALNIGNAYSKLNYYYGFNDTKMTDKERKALPNYSWWTGITRNSCGQITFDFSSDSVKSGTGDFSLTSLKNLSNAATESEKFKSSLVAGSKDVGSHSEAGMNSLSTVNAAKLNAVNDMRKTLAVTAKDFYNASAEGKIAMRARIFNDLNSETKKFISSSKDAATSLLTKENPNGWSDIAATMKQDGWMYAGSWYMQIYRIQTLISNISKVVPEYTDPGDYSNLVRDGDVGKVKGPMTVLDSNIKTFTDDFDTMDSKRMLAKEYDQNNGVERSESYSGLSVSAVFAKVVGLLGNSISNVTTGIIEANANSSTYNDNPLGLAFIVGDRLETAIWIMAPIVAGVGILSTSSILTTIVAFISPLISLMFIISNLLTVVLPFMPFFLWLGAVLGWAILCIEAVIAAPLWIMIHIHPDGDGVVGRGGAGYGMVLSLTIRPALMIMGLIAALICISVFAPMVNEMFLTAFYTIASRSGISLLQTPIMIGTYAMALFIVIKKSFSLIHVIPDEILKWLGVNNHNSVEKSSTGGLQTMMAAKMVDEKMGQMSMTNAMNEGKKVKKDKDDRKDNLDKVDAADQIENGISGLNEGASDSSNVEPSTSGRQSGLGETVADQNKNADAIISSMAGRPSSSMTNDERKSLYDAHKAKAENTENLMSSGAVKEGTAGYEALDKVRQSSIEGMANSGYTPSTSRDGTDTGRANDGSGSQVGGGNPGQNEGNGGGAGETQGNGGGAGGSESTGDNNEGGGGDNKPTKAK